MAGKDGNPFYNTGIFIRHNPGFANECLEIGVKPGGVEPFGDIVPAMFVGGDKDGGGWQW